GRVASSVCVARALAYERMPPPSHLGMLALPWPARSGSVGALALAWRVPCPPRTTNVGVGARGAAQKPWKTWWSTHRNAICPPAGVLEGQEDMPLKVISPILSMLLDSSS